jgi:hypothetical protein
MKSPVLRFVINLGLLLFGSVMAFSGLLIQFSYHMGNHGGIDTNNMVLGINYSGWSEIHKAAIIMVSVLMIFHIIQHWEWYKTIVKKHLVTKNLQAITLSIIFIFVAITGYIAWLIRLAEGDDTTRKGFIEIHDKLALILFVYLILHISKRLKWFMTSLYKLRK